MKKMFNEGNLKHNFISRSGSGTVISYGSGSDFLTSYGSGSTSQKVTVLTVPVPVPQHCTIATPFYCKKHQIYRCEFPLFGRMLTNSDLSFYISNSMGPNRNDLKNIRYFGSGSV